MLNEEMRYILELLSRVTTLEVKVMKLEQQLEDKEDKDHYHGSPG